MNPAVVNNRHPSLLAKMWRFLGPYLPTQLIEVGSHVD
ncbi:protein of unknown function [Acidithiobacillus ferrivorans]|uniref:Methyltransferase n=1 Tax=Acidithiobacillus ferrivorans TaxID=160808 RepID=A0ABY1MLU0_9PROT|nr:protein of unknown function [Acidithiobacillus ferrivorans]